MQSVSLLFLAGVLIYCQGANIDYSSYYYDSGGYDNVFSETNSYYGYYPQTSYGYNSYDYPANDGISYINKVRCRRATCSATTTGYNPCCPPPTKICCPTPPPPPPPPPVCCPVQCPRPCVPKVCPKPNPCVAGRRRRRNAQRPCHLDAHCPSDSVCCTGDCGGVRVCKKKSAQSDFSTTAIAVAKTPSSMVNMTVIMTSGSNSSAWFLKTQILPIMNYFHDRINLELVSYGLVNQEGHCQYGDADCFGNLLVSCSSKHVREQFAHLNFTICLMNYNHILQGSSLNEIWTIAQPCMEKIPTGSLLWPSVRDCVMGTEGPQLFQAAGQRQRQLAPAINQLPAILLNNVLSLKEQNELGYLSYMICHMLNTVPETRTICQQVFGQS